MKKKVAVIAYTDYSKWPMGGIINYINNILPYLEEHYNIDLWGCKLDQKSPGSVTINGKEYQIHSFGEAKTIHKVFPNAFRSAFEMFFHSKAILDMKYDVIYFHGSMLLYGFAFSGSRPLIVYHQHGLGISSTKLSHVYEYVQYKAMKKADLIFINSDKKSIAELIEQKFPKRINDFKQAVSPVNMNLFTCLSKEAKNELREKLNIGDVTVFVYTGRITEQKDPMFLLESFHYYLKRNSKAKLFFVGSGNLEKALHEAIEKYQLDNFVFITGNVDQNTVIQYLQVADVFLIASHGEGTSLSIAEALSCGLPVIGIDEIGIREFIIDGINGKLIKDRNKMLMCKAMEYVVQNDKLKKAARKSIEMASIANVCTGIIREIDERGSKKNG